MSEEPDRPAPRREAFAARQEERDRGLDAIHQLDAALGRAGEGPNWPAQVSISLSVLEAALSEELVESTRPDALLAMIAAENPRRFHSRVAHLRRQLEDLVRQIESLRGQIGDPVPADVTDLRHRIGSVIRAIHQHRARETDLVYEAIALDLGESS